MHSRMIAVALFVLGLSACDGNSAGTLDLTADTNAFSTESAGESGGDEVATSEAELFGCCSLWNVVDFTL